MKYKVVIYLSRLAFQDTKPNKDVAVVSISEPDQAVSNLTGWGAILELKFCDLTSEICGLPIFTARDAFKTIDFLEKANTSCNKLLVHCEAGVSRSGAVAYFAAEQSGLTHVYSMDRLEAVGSSEAINTRVMQLLRNEDKRRKRNA